MADLSDLEREGYGMKNLSHRNISTSSASIQQPEIEAGASHRRRRGYQNGVAVQPNQDEVPKESWLGVSSNESSVYARLDICDHGI